MTIKLKKQTIEILKVLKKKPVEVLAKDLVRDLKIDYIVLISAINDLIEFDLGGFKEEEIYQISLNDEGINYLTNGLPERQLLNILLENNIKELSVDELLKRSKLERNIFYIGISNLKKNRWVAQSKASGENKIYLILKNFLKQKSKDFSKNSKEILHLIILLYRKMN